MTRFPLLPGLAALLFAVPALAEETPPLAPDTSVFSGDFVIIGAGPVVVPSYEGADELRVIPAGAVAGRIGGIGINPRAAGVALDLIPDSDAAVGDGNLD